MSNIPNPFKEGDRVICIKDYFPTIGSTDKTKKIGEIPHAHPKLNEILEVDEVIGEYVRFDKYDAGDDIRWWICSHFRKLTYEECMDVCEDDLIMALLN